MMPQPIALFGKGAVDDGGTPAPAYSVSVSGLSSTTVTSASAQIASREFSTNYGAVSYSISKDPGDSRISGSMNGSIANRADFFVSGIAVGEVINTSFVVTATRSNGETASRRFDVSAYRSS